MKASLPRQRIIQLFDELDGNLAVITFDGEGKRVSTYGGLNPFLALAEVAHKLAIGQRSLILLFEGDQQYLPMSIEDIPANLIWNPDWRYMSKLK